TQAKILRVLQEREVFRLGAKQPRSAEVRVLAATNRDVEALVRSADFRGDLYHRIAGWEVTLPPLRERSGDIVNLSAHFLALEAARRGVQLAGLSHSAAEALLAWHWPGNIRELQREIARAVLFLGAGDLLESSHLREAIRDQLDRGEPTLKAVLETTERQHIDRALRRAAGDTAAAADLLGIGRSTLYRRMKALGVQDPTEPAS
ncbi:MAG: sigma 54-interacting transcriptional regulator, partial [Acidobacteriota bacterium]